VGYNGANGFLKQIENGRLKMSATIAIEIPREIVHVTRMTPQALKRELAEMTVWEFQQLLGSRGIPIHYDVEDYEQDLATLRELGQL
jgi:predicted HTH domain antitoxin